MNDRKVFTVVFSILAGLKFLIILTGNGDWMDLALAVVFFLLAIKYSRSEEESEQ